MARLIRTAVLGCHDQTIGGIRLRECPDLALVSLALPRGREAEAKLAISSAFGLNLPGPGQSVTSGTHRLIWMAPAQMMLVFADDSPIAEPGVGAALKGTCYTTSQTDGWVVMSISGPDVRKALNRLCPIDLHETAFPIDAVARTVMEHMGAMVLRDGSESFLLFSASSSAVSFLQAVEESIRFTT